MSRMRIGTGLSTSGGKFRWLSSAIVLLAAGGVFAQQPPTASATPQEALQAAEQGAPNLEVSSPVWDFGEVWSGEKAETTITIKNTGTAVLKIDQVKSSCGCTVAQTDKKELAPGETEDIRITYNTKKNAENVSQKIRIMTNDPDSPTTEVEVKGHVKPLIKIDGVKGLDMGSLGLNDTVTKSIELECAYTQPLNLQLKEGTPSKFFDIRLETLEAGKRYKLTATTRPPLMDGSLNESAVLITGVEQMPEFLVRVWGVAQGPLTVSPKVLYVMTDQNQPSTKTLRVVSRRETPIVITSVKADLDSIEAEVLPGPASGPISNVGGVSSVMIQVKLPAINTLPDRDIALRISFDDPEVKELIVPIRKSAGKPPTIDPERPDLRRSRPSLSGKSEKPD
jgi:hypothetical protein